MTKQPYSICSADYSENQWKCTVSIKADHPMFKGHFPGYPVVPGVLFIQIVKELLESGLNQKVKLAKAGSIKFLNPVVPSDDTLLEIDMKVMHNEYVNVDVKIKVKDTICFKCITSFLVV